MRRRAWLPLLCGLATGALTWWAWGAWDPVAFSHDENAYLLQAGIFAQGRWTDPPPPVPGFFEQVHVLSEPRRAAKYTPGHGLVLATGVALGLPAAVPVALAAAAGALIVALALRVSNVRTAVIAWLFWLAPLHPLSFRCSYFSEATTVVLWLAGWWSLERWSRTGRARWLVVLSFAVGWAAITRPLTAVAFAVPAAFAVASVRRFRFQARELAAGILPAVAVLALIPLSNARTVGDPRESPRALYTREYLPFDVPGFGPVADVPERPLPPDLRGEWQEYFQELHANHTISTLPATAFRRGTAIFGDIWGGWRLCLFPFAVFGFFVMPRPARVAVVSSALLFVLYLSYAHDAVWTVYYVESYPVLAFATAAGLAAALDRLRAWKGQAWSTAGLAGAVLVLSATSLSVAAQMRIDNRYAARALEAFRTQVRAIGDPRAVVFVRYAPDHDPHRSLVVNGPDLAHARTWIVYDLGAENARLCAAAPDRTPYLYDEASRRLVALPRDCAAPSL